MRFLHAIPECLGRDCGIIVLRQEIRGATHMQSVKCLQANFLGPPPAGIITSVTEPNMEEKKGSRTRTNAKRNMHTQTHPYSRAHIEREQPTQTEQAGSVARTRQDQHIHGCG